MKLRIINDIHIYGANPWCTKQELLKYIKESPHQVILNGDIVDIANCEYAKLNEAKEFIEHLKSLNVVYISGNHECTTSNILSYVKSDTGKKAMITHGDYAMWGAGKALKFRQQKLGAGWFKRNVISKNLDDFRRFLTVRPNQNLLNFISSYRLSTDIDVIVLGHSHPKETVSFEHFGVKGYIFPRGVNDFEF